MALAVAEEACAFEHRDLHWGNLLVQRDGSRQVTHRLRCGTPCALFCRPKQRGRDPARMQLLFDWVCFAGKLQP